MKNIHTRADQAYRSYKDKIYHVLFRYLKNHDDVEDVLQETFIKVIKFDQTFRNESEYSTWLTRIAINSALNHLKSQRKLGFVDFETAALFHSHLVNNNSAELCAIAQQELQIMDNNIKNVSDEIWKVFVLCSLEGNSLDDAAIQLNIPLGTVKSRLSRIRKLILGLE